MTLTDETVTDEPLALPDNLRYLMFEQALGSQQAKALGLRLDVLKRDHVVVAMPFHESLITFADVVHGGCIATLIDIAGACCFISGAGPDLKGGSTTAMNINYLAAARSTDLFATARVLRRGRVQTVSDVEVHGSNGLLVAKGIVTSQGY
jgi:uncharacterized protein (TIGR00369 family)